MKNKVMKQLKNRISFGASVLFMLCILALPVHAANKSNITEIKANKTTQIQLDGTGAKEKIKLTVEHKEDLNEDTYNKKYISTVILTVNGKEVFNNTYDTDNREPCVELVVTDINTKDKGKDLFLGVYTDPWHGVYRELVRITYKNKKAYTDNLLQTLKAIKSPKIDKDRDTSGRGYMLNPIEPRGSLARSERGALVVPGNGTVKWSVCLYTGTPEGDYLHSYITLTLKSGKLTAHNYPSGEEGIDGSSAPLLKSMTLYKSAGSSKKVATISKGKSVNVTGDFKFVNKKLYVKVEEYGKAAGWVPNSALSALKFMGTDHV